MIPAVHVGPLPDRLLRPPHLTALGRFQHIMESGLYRPGPIHFVARIHAGDGPAQVVIENKTPGMIADALFVVAEMIVANHLPPASADVVRQILFAIEAAFREARSGIACVQRVDLVLEYAAGPKGRARRRRSRVRVRTAAEAREAKADARAVKKKRRAERARRRALDRARAERAAAARLGALVARRAEIERELAALEGASS